MSSFENIVIFVSDSLRYDYFPEDLGKENEVIPTLAPSLHTPTSFASMHTARSPENHGVRGFLETLDNDYKVAFDFFENASFYDGPNYSCISDYIYNVEKSQDLDEMKEPFIWVERIMSTHLPYGIFSHDREEEPEISGSKYIEKMRSGEIDSEKEYQNGVEMMKEYVESQIDYLERKGILDDTLVIITSDHGEALGERYLGRKRFEHNYPPIKEIAEVPTVFYNYDLDAKAMRLIDIIPTALGILGKNTDIGDGVDVRKNKVREGRNIMDDPKANFDTKWEFDEGWRLSTKSNAITFLKTLKGDTLQLGYRKGGKELKDKLENISEEKGAEVKDIEV